MRAEDDAKAERWAGRGAHSVNRGQPQALYPPSATTTYHSSIPSQWSPPGKPLVSGEPLCHNPRQPELAKDGYQERGRRLILGSDSQLQPLHGRRRPCCPPLAQGGQEIGCRAQRRDGPEIRQVGGALYLILCPRRDRIFETDAHATDPTPRSTTTETVSLTELCPIQNGKQGESKNLAASIAESSPAAQSS